MKDYSKILGAKVNDQTYADFVMLAKKLGMNKSDLVRKAISDQLKKNELLEMKQESAGIAIPEKPFPTQNKHIKRPIQHHFNQNCAIPSRSAENKAPMGLVIVSFAMLVLIGACYWNHAAK